MKKNLLMWDETLFRDPEVFEIDHVPEQFNHRDAQIRELAFQVRPGLRGARPLNTVCRGPPGTGKTTSVKKVFAEIEEATKKLAPVYINCQIDNTKFAVFSQIYRKVTGRSPPASGTSFKQVFDAIARALLREEQVLLVALDDANYLLYENEINHVLYPLLRSHEAYPGVRIGVIAIVSDMSVSLQNEVDARVASVFRPTEIYFPPYSEEEVRGILEERILQGLYLNVLRSDMLDLVVEQTMKSGDLRVGIDLLKRATLNAEKEARRSVEREDICKAYEVSRYLHLTYSLRALKAEERGVLGRIAEMSARDDREMNAGDVYRFVKEEVRVGYTKYYEILRKFDAMRLINLHYRQGKGQGKGRTRLISLRYDPRRVLEYLR
ncbi:MULTISPECIES: ORC1-type DNA replication protein [unclassified Methanoculleus]|uniref:ORC1-type DNA replication protein n=1 Tax=unclassified Methanoculleus TaxID=2619537 RepID=UPI0025E35167|nr:MULTISPECIES: ORC1-type DNA replication protein [unclassified Methanoculleus]MCK9297365.1 ORC1-type DNA replication protein [Methanoculleus sp.]MDD2253371.1 ORC1-type DNA replication protein [Methanoculleus sp.]MDD2787005.1 ORC1-type DNA replication protein [Methanoculleus sp.]MDD3216377.1 ORC1-type DNA replication protein [Methanoculleus sp.]MDD4314361.1 ORC1-type DNA replication protein [Methanoculleus sp.]